ncbi:MAG: magnesium transport protein CorA [Acidimicrobiales bacterium]|nr:MAG: magnesium transport protein CorA [Acidimicrobiales bacterium]
MHMETRALAASDGTVSVVPDRSSEAPADGWLWVDITVGRADVADLLEFTAAFELDPIAVHDAVDDFDLPKLDDFGSHLLAIIHGLADDRIESYEIDCFLTGDRALITVHERPSPAIDTLWDQVQRSRQLASGGADDLLARLADVATRRFVAVIDEFENRVETLIDRALAADPTIVADVTAMRRDLGQIRRVTHPQREAFDQMRSSTSPLLSDQARRRFSDVFDVAGRAAGGIDNARTSLAETLDAYRGAEAGQATEVSKVLTVYAAVMLPLSLVAGIFGMNFSNLPWVESENGWLIVSGIMIGMALVSLGMFVSVGWIRRPTARGTGQMIGRGLMEAARTPASLVGGVFEVSTKTIRDLPGRDATDRS